MLCQFLVLAGKGFGSNTHVLLRLMYSCGGVLVFWLQWEIVFGVLHLVYNTVVLLCQLLDVAGNSSQNENIFLK